MASVYLPEKLFDGTTIREDIAVIVEAGSVSEVVDRKAVGAVGTPLAGLLAPGFIDVQVNGGGGVLFNDERIAAGIGKIGQAHRRFGTTGYMATFITDTRERMQEAIAAADAAMAAGEPGLLGIHVEGPFINPLRKGVHDPAYMRPLEAADLAILTGLKKGRTLVTLAPERVDPGQIQALTAAGVIVCAGHTVAEAETMAAAKAEGLSGLTHLYNAMPPMAGREPGPVGFAFADDTVMAGLIVDGFHVSKVGMRAALHAMGPERIMLVTDAMPGVGTELESFMLLGRKVTRRDGRCVLDAGGSLAGSDLDMASAVRNARDWLGVTLEQALRMASAVPAAFLGLGHELGRIAPGYRADFVLLDQELTAKATWIGGVFAAA